MELKPCPFCGGEARIVYRSPMVRDDEFRCIWEVGCIRTSCGVKRCFEAAYVLNPDDGDFLVKHDGRTRAIEAWNRRADHV